MTTEVIPWNMESIYPGLESPEYAAAVSELKTKLSELEATFEKDSIGGGEPLDIEDLAAFAQQLESLQAQLNDLVILAETLVAFIYGYVSTDSYNELANRELSKIEQIGTRQQQLFVKLQVWTIRWIDHLPELKDKSSEIAAHAYFWEDQARQAKYLMTEELEALASVLCLDGGQAFGKLQGNVTSQLVVPFVMKGSDDPNETQPITVVNNLRFDPDPEVRERAYYTEIEGWKSIQTTVAACLNGVKGTALTLAAKRNRGSLLAESLDQNRIDEPTLTAMMDSIATFLPEFQCYLKQKASLLGKEQLPWWDLFAPVGKTERHFSWSEAKEFILKHFYSFDDSLGNFAKRSFDEDWIDVTPRSGKRGGAFCMEVPGVEESRILMNFDGSFEQVMTLAHELGHGYHNDCQKGLEGLRRGSPATLAETASIFCETLVANAVLKEATPEEQLSILELQLSGAAQVCVDIRSRFLFEQSFLEQRALGELSAREICDLMLQAQADNYGDGVDPATYHPYMWLWKPHYYTHDHHFYNYPYAFGHLFGLGLFAIYRQEAGAFIERYRQLLRDTGQADAPPLAERFGLDIRSPEFWEGSLRLVTEQVDRFVALAKSVP
ncbi:Oligoendopeptidase F [Planctomycetales bacterium 10988]|nr:Oligoendopeptidase F [Planctomycetales bacterium 10988]